MKKEKYTYADVIIDPNDERVKIGVDYYFGLNPTKLLELVNKGWESFKLTKVDIDSCNPFIRREEEYGDQFSCIIKVKESQAKYVPYDLSKKEVRYKLRGKWIVYKHGGCSLEELIHCFVKTDGIWSCNSMTAERLLRDYTFPDGTPCGEKVEE